MSSRKQSYISILFILLLFGVVGYGILIHMNNNIVAKKVTHPNARIEKATFAGGCFWCMESLFQEVDGVLDVVSGFSGGEKENPTYEEVSAGKTKHAEAVQVTYDANQITYETLLDMFWRSINPTDADGQFVDRGSQYRSAIFYHNDEQKKLAEASKKKLEKSGKFEKQIATEIVEYKNFYEAEDYHQDYYKNNSLKYKFYSKRSGRNLFLDDVWGNDREVQVKDNNTYADFKKPDDDTLEKKLTDIQYKVTQKDGTEKAFNNEYWNNKEEGIYVDVLSGEPLFSSKNKYDSGTGWPSFTQPIDSQYIKEETDWGILGKRTEIRSKYADSHLGHVFNDGPGPSGLRYCMNSAALKFIPKNKMGKEGYSDYLKLFE